MKYLRDYESILAHFDVPFNGRKEIDFEPIPKVRTHSFIDYGDARDALEQRMFQVRNQMLIYLGKLMGMTPNQKKLASVLNQGLSAEEIEMYLIFVLGHEVKNYFQFFASSSFPSIRFALMCGTTLNSEQLHILLQDSDAVIRQEACDRLPQ